MRWCALLLVAGCVARPLDGPSAAATDDLAARDLGAHDLGAHDLAIADLAIADLAAHDLAAHDLATHDAAVPSDLASPADLALPALDWQEVPLPNPNDWVQAVSGWSTSVLVATQTFDSQGWLHGSILTFDGTTWTTLLDVSPGDPYAGGFNGVYAISETDFYALVPGYSSGDHTSHVIKGDGSAWTEEYTAAPDLFYNIKQLESGELVVTGQVPGQGGSVYVREAAGWVRHLAPRPAAYDFFAVWGKNGSDLYAAGWPKSFEHWNGTDWEDHSPGNAGRFFFAWGTDDDDVWFGGPNLYHWDGTSDTAAVTGADYFYDVWSPASDRAWVVGCVGPSSCSSAVIYSFDGTTWSPRTPPPGNAAYKIWGRSDDDLWVVSWGKLYHHGP